MGGRHLQLVHRDVSPANILLSYAGAVKLTDFGVARIRREEPLTEAGVRKGTLRDMAPEQLRNVADPRSDIFSLGAILWELLTNQPLFEGPTEEAVAKQIRERPIAAPSSYLPEIPAALDAIALKALRRRPEERYQSARDLALALRSLALTPTVDAFELGSEVRRLFPPPPVQLPPDETTLPDLHEEPAEYVVEGPTIPDQPVDAEPAPSTEPATVTPAPTAPPARRRLLTPVRALAIVGGLVALALGVRSFYGSREQSPLGQSSPGAAGRT